MIIKAIWEFDVDDSWGETITDCKKITEIELDSLIKENKLDVSDFEFVREAKEFYTWDTDDIVAELEQRDLDWTPELLEEIREECYYDANENDWLSSTLHATINDCIDKVLEKHKPKTFELVREYYKYATVEAETEEEALKKAKEVFDNAEIDEYEDRVVR